MEDIIVFRDRKTAELRRRVSSQAGGDPVAVSRKPSKYESDRRKRGGGKGGRWDEQWEGSRRWNRGGENREEKILLTTMGSRAGAEDQTCEDSVS